MEAANISLRDLQFLELEIMKEIHKICEENGLTYFLGYGSCIGAIRHKGFIPWDDDMDIVMPLPDYLKFIEITKNNSGRYQLYSVEKDPACIYPFAKYIDTYTELDEFVMEAKKIGVYIDIFPLCGVPSDANKIKKLIKKFKYIDYMVSVARKKKPIGKSVLTTIAQCILFPFAKGIGVSRLNQVNIKYARQENYSSSMNVANLPPIYGVREVMNKHIFDDKIEVEFENQKFYVPSGYHEYLTNLYGDYMQFPPEDKRVPKHPFTVKFLH